MTSNSEASAVLSAATTMPLPRVRLAPQPVQPQLALLVEPSRYERLIKPVVDRIAGVVLLLAVAPILMVIAMAVYLRLGRPILIGQTRIGQLGRPFTLYKFRTMHPDRRKREAPIDFPDRRRTHKHPNDPRHTPLGRFLRKYSLDELPQMFNVARGDMSLVGPRPEMAEIVARYQPWQHARHRVKPGLSGLWQVTERGNGLMHEHTEIDLLYARNVSLRGDLGILVRTVPIVFGRSCAGD
jgi:lipopolysaccharide/colanic/teichoic acid biosynthesis glycosyltransferase